MSALVPSMGKPLPSAKPPLGRRPAERSMSLTPNGSPKSGPSAMTCVGSICRIAFSLPFNAWARLRDWACQSRRAAGPSSNQFVKRFTVRLLIQNDEATTNRADVRKQACRDQIAIIADIDEACTLSFRMLLC